MRRPIASHNMVVGRVPELSCSGGLRCDLFLDAVASIRARSRHFVRAELAYTVASDEQLEGEMVHLRK